MKSLLHKPAQLLAAFAVAVGLGAPAAMANDTQVDATEQTVGYAEQQYASLSRDEAKLLSAPEFEGGAGRVVLFVGAGFDDIVLKSLERQFERNNINIEVITGGENPGHLQVFINNDELQKDGQSVFLDAPTADKYLFTVLSRMIQERKLNVYAQADTYGPSQEPV